MSPVKGHRVNSFDLAGQNLQKTKAGLILPEENFLHVEGDYPCVRKRQ